MTLHFSPSGQLLSPQNVNLRHIRIEIDYATCVDGLQLWDGYELTEAFNTMVDMAVSRWKPPDNAISFDGCPIRRLLMFEVGPELVNLYKHQEPVTWPAVARGWKNLEGIVQFWEEHKLDVS